MVPAVGKISLRWEAKTAVIMAPGPALFWSLLNRQNQIQKLLQTLTGKALNLRVVAGPGDAERSEKEGMCL